MAQPEYVGFWRRVLAAAIDFLILFVVTTPILLAIYGRRYFALVQSGTSAGFWDFVIEYVVPAVAVVAFWRRYGATPGKMAVGAKIVDAKTGERPSTARLVLRYVAYLVSALPLFLGFLWIGVSRRKQGFHDKIARTMVIYDD
ncbi:MAG TPA: RDD family protein [Burkholderiales bacterium]|nr:RDD family protein [Burkholderiales bacterium]